MVAHSETGWSRRCGITPVKSRSRQQEYAPRFLRAHLLLDVVPNLGGGEVLAAEGVRVDLRGGGDGRVAEAFADGRQVHAFLQQEARVAVADRVEACTLGQTQVPAHPRHRARDRIRLQRRPVSVAEDQVQIGAVVRAVLAPELVLADAVRLQACQHRWRQFDHAGLLCLGVLELQALPGLRQRPRQMKRRSFDVGPSCGQHLAARWSDIKGSAFHLTRSLSQTREGLEFKNTKTERPRVIELPPSMLARLEAHRIHRSEFRRQFGSAYRRDLDLIFCNTDGTPLKPDSISGTVSRMCRDLGLPKGASLHTVRHSHASLLLSEGVDIDRKSTRLNSSHRYII